MFRSNLLLKSFATITAGVFLLSLTFYFLSVPMIDRMTFNVEEKAGRNLLENMYLLVGQSYKDMERWRDSEIEGHRRELRDIVSVVVSYIEGVQKDVERGRLSRDGAQREVLRKIRSLTYGKNDYIWVSDYRSVLISHPDPKLNGKDFSHVRDVHNQLIVPPMVEGARTNGEGFYSYWWRRLGEDEPVEKLSYYRNIPSWNWVVGTGVYIDDINREVSRRRSELVGDLRKHIRNIKIAGNGYMYIFDSRFNMIIHPNSNIEGTNIASLLDPVTGKSLAKELISAAALPDNKLEYKWDKPSDPGNYSYNKISWVHYLPGVDWYIASSVYTEDLERSADALTRRILWVCALGLLLSIGGVYFFVHTFASPIKQLADSANRISRGDLSPIAASGRKDEIGILSTAINNMVEQLKFQIKTLEERVDERTAELSGWVRELEQRNQEIVAMNKMGDLLQSCISIQEMFTVICKTVQAVYPESGGVLLTLNSESKLLEAAAGWGDFTDSDAMMFSINDCWGIRRGKLYLVSDPAREQICPHVNVAQLGTGTYMCVPMIAQGELLGVLHIVNTPSASTPSADRTSLTESKIHLAETVAEHASLAVANMKLQQSLQIQSIRDPLTGLYNRRYLEEAIGREEHRARRKGMSVGIVMCDLDHFKHFNDTFGHDAGDAVLREVGEFLNTHFREEDIVCRFGGEEFTVILPGSDLKDCLMRSETLRKNVETQLRLFWKGRQLHVTVSLGVASYPSHGCNLKAVIRAADGALLLAKERGRNCVVAAQSEIFKERT
jgi:diguanylate cyclase (GGDEF)-like protein